MTEFSVTQNGIPLSEDKYTWDVDSRTFSTTEDNLLLDFAGINYCTFNTGSTCTFITGDTCNFNAGSTCTFNTGYYCTFFTGSHCTFNTLHACSFKTVANCIFNTGNHCTFDTGSNCIFKTGKYCVIVRRDVFEVIKLEKKVNHIKLNGFKDKGFVNMNKRREFKVVWEIELDANNATEAAQTALEVQRDGSSDATCFTVFDKAYQMSEVIDLDLTI